MGVYDKGLRARQEAAAQTKKFKKTFAGSIENNRFSGPKNAAKKIAAKKISVLSDANEGFVDNIVDRVDGGALTADAGFANSENVKPQPLPRIENPMHKFASANHVFTLCALTLDEVNFPDETIMIQPPKYVAAKSAGGSSRETQLNKGSRLEFYIENLEIDAIVHSNPTTGHTKGTTLNFNVAEPFSLGLFLTNLQLQVAQAAGTPDANYLTHPMALIIETKGAVDKELSTLERGQLRKVLPIQLMKVDFSNSNGISNYSVQAVIYNDIAFSDQYQTIPTDVELKGETLEEMIFSGEQSLAKYLNEKNLDNEPGFFAKLIGKKAKPVSIRDYIFLFPNKEQNVSEAIKRGAEQSNKIVQIDTGDLNPTGYGFSVSKTFGSLYKNLTYSTKEGFSGEAYNPNVIGKSRMITDYLNNSSDAGKGFADDNTDKLTYYDKKTKTYTRGSAKIDFHNKHIAFKKGTSIVKIIEDLILCSEYGQSILKRKKESDTGLINWFTIIPGRYVFNDDAIKKQYNMNPEVIMFRIVPYAVPDDKFMAPDEVSRIPSLDYLVRKQYDIIYTGQNKDVIDFNVEFNSAFFTALQNDLGNNSPNNKDSADSSVKRDKKNASMSTANNSFTPINPAIGFGDPRGRDGGNAETLELRFARQFNEAILNSDVDLVKLTLNIVGDPYYVPQSGLGNYVSKGYYSLSDQPELFLDGDANANFLSGVVLTKVNFRTPIDIDGDGSMAFTDVKEDKAKTSGTELQTLGEFSGFYYPIKVRSSYAGNKFIQEIEMIRVKTGNTDAPGVNTKSVMAVGKNDVMDEISQEVSDIATRGDDGLNPYQT